MEKIILDTSLFVNPDVRVYFGNSPTNALKNFLKTAKKTKRLRFYAPPSVLHELFDFVNLDEIPEGELFIIKGKPPKKYEIPIPGLLLYELINEARKRIDKGLRIAEKAVRSTEVKEKVIKDLRANYREALREGIIDSSQDVDLILLARELDGLLVTADQGIVVWAEKLGIRCLDPHKFKEYLQSH
jgi:hypothetical protein